MSDMFREVTHESWFSRIKNAFIGILFGIILMGIAFGLLFWNEGRTVERKRALDEGAGIVIAVPADSVDPANDGQLVHITALAETQDMLADSQFQVSVNAVRFKRNVQMYQWEENSKTETRKKLG